MGGGKKFPPNGSLGSKHGRKIDIVEEQEIITPTPQQLQQFTLTGDELVALAAALANVITLKR